MIDWGIAERVAVSVAGEATAGPLPGDLDAMAARARADVLAYTGLVPAAPLPAPEAVDRRGWTRANVASMRSTLDPLAGTLLGHRRLPGPVRGAAGTVLGAEIGGIVGFMGRHVLGQYDLRLLDPEHPARLLLVAPNLRSAAGAMGVELEELLQWVVFHEVTHAIQFGSVPWLSEHVGGLVRELLESAQIEIEAAALLRLPTASDLRGAWERVRADGFVAVVAGPERRALLDRIQATMALIEGHAEHVMDAAAREALPSLPRLRAALDARRRDRPPLMRVLERLLGIELKLRQYELGKRFCDAVVADWGVAALNAAWSGPEWLPTLDELDDPPAWVRRTQARAVPPAA